MERCTFGEVRGKEVSLEVYIYVFWMLFWDLVNLRLTNVHLSECRGFGKWGNRRFRDVGESEIRDWVVGNQTLRDLGDPSDSGGCTASAVFGYVGCNRRLWVWCRSYLCYVGCNLDCIEIHTSYLYHVGCILDTNVSIVHHLFRRYPYRFSVPLFLRSLL